MLELSPASQISSRGTRGLLGWFCVSKRPQRHHPGHFPIIDLLIFSPASFRVRICSCIFLSASIWG